MQRLKSLFTKELTSTPSGCSHLCYNSLISDGYGIVRVLALPCPRLIHKSQILVHDVSNNRAMNIQSD